MKLKNIALTTLLAIGVTSAAHAGTNAQMTITGDVVAATCDVSLSTSSLDLGNFTPAQFTAIATPIADNAKSFTVGLNNCTAPMKTDDAAGLVVTGQTVGGNPNMFNSTGTTTGVMLKVAGTANYIKNNDKLPVATAGATPAASDFNSKVVTLEANLGSTAIPAQLGHISAPILFSFAYN